MTSTEASPPSTVGGGRYLLGDLIGRGGAAEVYVARDELLGRDVAVKLFPPGVGEADESRRQREVQTLAGLNHPGLVTIYDVGQEGSRAFFVMQLIEGESLADRLRTGPLSPGDVVALGAALADALTYVHRHGVVHRDIKPGNVLLDGEGRPHLSDFGIAVLADATNITATGMVIGTASYLSPEQVRGQQVGPASDVYALGLVLLECVTGHREFPGNALEAAVARLHRAPEIPADLPAPLGHLLAAMTADDPATRPTTEQVVGEMRAMSREAGMDAETVLAPSPTGSGAMRTTALGPGTAATQYADPMGGPTQRMGTPPGGWQPPPDRTALVGGGTAGYAGGVPPAAPRKSRKGVIVAVLAALLVAGGVGAWALLGGGAGATAPAVGPAPVPVLEPSTTERSRSAERSSTRVRTTTPTPTSSVVPPPVTTTAPPTTTEPPSTTDRPNDNGGQGDSGNGNGGGNGNGSSTSTSSPFGGLGALQGRGGGSSGR